MDQNEILEVTARIKKYAFDSVSKKRFEHSVRVAETAEFLCEKFGLDESLGYLAGIAHDICKSESDERLMELALSDGRPLSKAEEKKIPLLHGRAAAVLLREKFGITDDDVIQAVASHTLGEEHMSPLAKIIYVADKVEPGRPQSTDEYREKLFAKSLNQMTLWVLEENMNYLKERGKVIAEESADFHRGILNDIAKEGGK